MDGLSCQDKTRNTIGNRESRSISQGAYIHDDANELLNRKKKAAVEWLRKSAERRQTKLLLMTTLLPEAVRRSGEDLRGETRSDKAAAQERHAVRFVTSPEKCSFPTSIHHLNHQICVNDVHLNDSNFEKEGQMPECQTLLQACAAEPKCIRLPM